jgi:hypothetical protein
LAIDDFDRSTISSAVSCCDVVGTGVGSDLVHPAESEISSISEANTTNDFEKFERF